MDVKLGMHVYLIVSMTTTNKNSLRHFSLESLLYSSNSLTVARMEVKFGMHVYFIVSMTTSMHGDEINAHVYFNEWRQVNQKSYGLKKGEHIGMV